MTGKISAIDEIFLPSEFFIELRDSIRIDINFVSY